MEALEFFFGGLGIGTGSGSGGAMGYKPLTEGSVTIGTSTGVVRPSVPVDIGATELLPLDTVDASAPAVVPLEDVPVTSVEFDDTINMIAEVHPTTNVAVMEVESVNVAPNVSARRIAATSFHNPTFQPPFVLPFGETTTGANVFIDISITEAPVAENLELSNINLEEAFPELEIEDIPRTSTPSVLQRIRNFRNLYRRGTQQVQVPNRQFLSRPASLVQFDNPAFEGDISLEFARDVDNLARAAPDAAFADIRTLSRPIFSEQEGRVRLSRLGTRGTLRTRSGAEIGGAVHFYQDISSILPEEIELATLGEESTDAAIVTNTPELSYRGVEDIVPEEEIFEERSLTSRPYTPIARRVAKFIAQRIGNTFYSFPEPSDTSAGVPFTEIENGREVVIVQEGNNSGTFYLHPSLLRKKKKRKYVF
ncbi:L2 [Morelia spilota papillomavirus 1]|uniref:L2 n=1 Tax=Morelia spilota papillomavirus 1 TaxID=1081054 RepID=G3DRD5_9PAPI|nr:L2 [Morelia spilota papillomavirus 1]AEO16191.1 L2 [Morelia spilota papillomavirus 1]